MKDWDIKEHTPIVTMTKKRFNQFVYLLISIGFSAGFIVTYNLFGK
jgi:hypothetical protein